MTEQARLSGDASNDAGLDDSIAFSRYIEAIDRISHQYSLWQKQQDELKKHYEYYETAASLVQATDQELPLIPSTLSDLSASWKKEANFLSISKVQSSIDQGSQFLESYRDLSQNINASKNANKSLIEGLENQHLENRRRCENYTEDLEKSQIQLKQLKEESQLRLYFGTFIIILALICLINYVWQTILCGIFLGWMTEAFSLDGPSKHTQKEKSVEKHIKDLEGYISDLDTRNASIQKDLLVAKLDFNKYLQTSNSNLQQIKIELLGCLIDIPESTYLARYLYTEVAPSDFQNVAIFQKSILDQVFKYWEYEGLNPDTSTPRMLVCPWQDSSWQDSYQPVLDSLTAPDCIRIGTHLIEELDVAKNCRAKLMDIPAVVPIRSIKDVKGRIYPGHIVIFSNTQTRDTAIQLLESIATRLISTFPVRTLKGSFIDPIALGNTFPFKGLPKSILSGQQIFTRNQDIREELKTLVTHVEQVIQNYLGRSYETLEDYNADSQSIAEPYRYLFIADFPTAFDSNTADELKSLITNGGRAGVYSIIHVDTSRDRLRDFDYELFDRYCTVIRSTDRNHEGNRLFELKMPNGWKRELLLDRPPTQELHQHIIQAIVKVEKTIKIETIDFKNLYPEALWQSNSQQELRAPIGLTGARERIEFWLGENDEKITVSSGLLAGKPGAGKSYTLHSIILSLAMQYSPAELELYLLDYKEGVEFQIYVDPNRSQTQNPTRELDETRALPHAKVISIESDREFGLSVLQSVQRELEARGQLFKDVGVSELKDYRQKTGKQIPRVLVVIDEFQYMFQDNDAITRDLNQLYEDITRRGRSFGVHLLLASQSLNINNINNRIYGFIPLRMAMQMDQTTANIVLAEGNTDAVELLDRSGRIIYNTEFGRKRQNQLGQIADVSLEARRNAMNRIHTQTQESNYQRPEPIVIFQGNRPSKITQNSQLLQLTRLDNWLPSSQLNKQIIKTSDWLAPEVPSALWIGEAMRIGHHTHAILRRRARSNMLLIGQSESSIFGMISGALLSLVHIHPQAEFHIIDLSQTDDNETLSELTHTFQTAFQNLYPIKLGKRFPDSTQNIKRAEKILEELYEILQTRKQIRDADPDTMDFGPSIFFIAAIGALSRAQYLRPIAGPRNADEMSPNAKQLQELITLGPELGIHTLLWLDNATTFQQLCANNAPRTLLSQFDCRAVLTLSAEDSRFFLGETIAQTLPTLRGYFYDASLSSGYEKFKPYAIPTPTEITQTAEKLQQRPR